ncbi:hypothetical protein SUGI_0124930 [Cryptomeria japonica]|nr:hypothetical protein SUGI_0124930 [Cryptomeria japonica]
MVNPSLIFLAIFVALFALTTTVSEEIRKPYIIHTSKSMKPLHFSLHEHCQVENCGCLAAIPSSVAQIHTTHSPQFLGLGGSHKNLWPRSHYGKDVIVGVIDSGIWPESKSFNDKGLGPVPEKWKGVCQNGKEFNSSHCNRKIIGARYFFKGFEAQFGKLSNIHIKSARDTAGHGTHCASTTAGSKVGIR